MEWKQELFHLSSTIRTFAPLTPGPFSKYQGSVSQIASFPSSYCRLSDSLPILPHVLVQPNNPDPIPHSLFCLTVPHSFHHRNSSPSYICPRTWNIPLPFHGICCSLGCARPPCTQYPAVSPFPAHAAAQLAPWIFLQSLIFLLTLGRVFKNINSNSNYQKKRKRTSACLEFRGQKMRKYSRSKKKANRQIVALILTPFKWELCDWL